MDSFITLYQGRNNKNGVTYYFIRANWKAEMWAYYGAL